jgi:hypothetical protein
MRRDVPGTKRRLRSGLSVPISGGLMSRNKSSSATSQTIVSTPQNTSGSPEKPQGEKRPGEGRAGPRAKVGLVTGSARQLLMVRVTTEPQLVQR